MKDNYGRHAFTMTELVVAIAIVGLLAAIVGPAVQSSRESARRAHCSNNLRQLGIALANVAESHGDFPTSTTPVPAFWRLLPSLGHAPLFDELSTKGIASQLNVSEFVCPDDSLHLMGFGNSNYYFNDGTRFRWDVPRNGFRISPQSDTSAADISDGLSNTAAMSERLVGVPTFDPPSNDVMEKEPRRYFWFSAVRYNQKGQELLATNECRNNRTTVFPQFAGTYIQQYREAGAGYNHMLTPNEAACYNGPEDLNIDTSSFLKPPSSMHPNGVNVLYADGSVHFIADGISDDAWRALGTRNGSEATNISF